MKALITGAAGFIGSWLARMLRKDGAELVLIDNFSYGKEDNLVFEEHDFTKEVIRMDIRDRNGIKSIMQAGDIDYVYNIAGIAPLPDCQLNPQEAIDVNVNGFVNILENARIYGVKKIIQASTNAIYENATEFPVREDSFPPPTLIYPNTKFAAERFAQSYCDTYGMSVVCVRFANVYGPHADCLRKQPPFVPYLVKELYYGRTPVFHSDGTQRRDYVYVEDLVKLLTAVRKGTGFDAVNASGNASYSVNEIYQLAQEITGKHIPAVYADDRHYWEKYPGLFHGAYTIKDDILSHEINKFSLCDNAHAREKYGWQPETGMREGLEKLIKEEFRFLEKYEKKSECK